MSKRKNYHRKPLSDAKKAMQKGIVPIRRRVSPDDHELLKEAGDRFKKEFRGAARVYDVDTVEVTLIGISRFDRRLLGQGPKSSSIIDRVPSCKQSLSGVQLGRLRVFGSKLAFELHNAQIPKEITALESVYESRGFALREPPHIDKEEGYVPHCTIANLYEQGRAHFQDERALAHLNFVAGIAGKIITLQQVELPSFK